MTPDRIAATLAAAVFFSTSSGFGGTWAAEPWPRSFPRVCTAELQKCLEKLEARLRFHGGTHEWLDIENALNELHETDPECALLLRDRGVHGL